MEKQYMARVQRLQGFLKDSRIDYMLVTSMDSIYYLSGATYMPLERPFFIVVKQNGEPELIVPRLEQAHMRKIKGFGEIKSYFEYPSIEGENWYDRLCDLTGENAIIGIEPSLSVQNKEKINAKKTVIIDEIDRMRMVKDDEEIAAVKYASMWTDKGMKLLHQSLYRGQSVLETVMPTNKIKTGVVAATDFNYLTSSFLTAGWPAPKSAQPHSLPDLNSRMGDGPIVLMSFNRVNGYAAECERTVFLNEPTKRERELFGYMIKAREIAFSMLKPGARCHDIDMATRTYFESVGCGENVLHRTGHGIGMGNHERPWISAGSDDVLQENMIISVEPAIYFNDIGGFRHSDTVLITKDGYEIITKYPTSIEELMVKQARVLSKVKGAIIRKSIGY
ncbi:MAG: putative peptidase [Firmicutes bacterium ADurb.Bin182]|nr:MAG: putative peptidase [Firmicutes bacterium ADurb.Bin182]